MFSNFWTIFTIIKKVFCIFSIKFGFVCRKVLIWYVQYEPIFYSLEFIIGAYKHNSLMSVYILSLLRSDWEDLHYKHGHRICICRSTLMSLFKIVRCDLKEISLLFFDAKQQGNWLGNVSVIPDTLLILLSVRYKFTLIERIFYY